MRSAGVIILGLTGAWGHGNVSKVKILDKLDENISRQHVLP